MTERERVLTLLRGEQPDRVPWFGDDVKRVLDTWVTKPRYVLGVADQVPPYSSPERIMRVRTLVDRYGRY
ncbi:MAG: hypothetical protein ACOX63_02755 [Christensenellales bacterium]|jgi:uroporphyrinogen-III decarboxylase